MRPGNPAVARALFPEALALLQDLGFRQRGEWLELEEEAVAGLPAWLERLAEARLERSIPDALRVTLGNGALGPLHLLQGRCTSRHWRREVRLALQQVALADLDSLLKELKFDGWFSLSCAVRPDSAPDPIDEFHDALVGSPLTCQAGGDMRIHRAAFQDVARPDAQAFFRLNPWEMLKVGPYGARPRPEEPAQEWWAKLYVLVAGASALRGRQWSWSERTSQGGTNAMLYVRHVIYCLVMDEIKRDAVTVTMRAVWNSTTY